MAMESWVVERAREELELLEAHHPGRFDYLKLELKALIFDPNDAVPFSLSASTQVSSNRKRKGCDEARDGDDEPERRKRGRFKDRVDVAIEKAEACLRRIRQVKESLFL